MVGQRRGPTADPVVEAAAAFIRARADEPLTIADVADEVGYSEFHFTRRFTAGIGISPGRYLTGIRFQRAKKLILRDSLPVLEVCHAVGFSSPGTFTRRFAREVGVAPATLRRVADRLAGPSLEPFHTGPDAGRVVPTHITSSARHPTSECEPIVAGIRIPKALRGELGDNPLVWVGLFTRPVPSGAPVAGVLRRGDGDVHLPVMPGAPWLLTTAVRAQADPLEHLIPPRPIAAGHPMPLLRGQRVEITLRHTEPSAYPLVFALGSLAPT